MQLQVFKFEEEDHFSEVRTVDLEGEIWFVGSDVATLLGYSNPSKAISDHCREKGITKRYPLLTSGGTQIVTLINEPNVYRLISRSKLPSAEKFEVWLFEEVLPSIRKTGGYGITHQLIPTYQKRILSNPVKGLPFTHWCVFTESHSVMLWIEANIGSINQYDLADGSIGIKWSAFRKGKSWAVESSTYIHDYDDKRGPREAKCYQNSESQHFREWLETVYKRKHLYTYLRDKYKREKNTLMLDRVNIAMPKLLGGDSAAA